MKTSVLISGYDDLQCEGVRRLLEGEADLQVTRQPLGGAAQINPLHGPLGAPDVLIAVLGARADDVLRQLPERSPADRPALIVVGPADDAAVLRRAMRAGARDYLTPPLQRAELQRAIRAIGRERHDIQSDAASGSLTAVVNAKGGSGASFIAANLAHVGALQTRSPVALIDLDLQFGDLPLALDLKQRNSLLSALANASQLDSLALQGYMAQHRSGVHVLSVMPDELSLAWQIAPEALDRILGLVRQSYGRTVADLPRQIDPLTSIVLSQANRILVVMQQSLAHIRDAKRLLRFVGASLGVPSENITLVVNRYSEKDSVSLRDITRTVGATEIVPLPNAFGVVSSSLNAGVPVVEFDRRAPISQALLDLGTRLSGTSAAPDAPASRKADLHARRSFRDLIAHPFGG